MLCLINTACPTCNFRKYGMWSIEKVDPLSFIDFRISPEIPCACKDGIAPVIVRDGEIVFEEVVYSDSEQSDVEAELPDAGEAGEEQDDPMEM